MDAISEERLKSSEKIHFVGVGGISMSTLAALAQKYGYRVSGSDMNRNDLTDRLADSGVEIIIGNRPENVVGADAVVYTAAIFGKGKEEVEAAEKAGILTVSRGEFLGFLMKNYKCRIGVSGTHGKTTTTSMISHLMIKAEMDPTVANGAVAPELGGAYRAGGRDYFVYEACEYKDSFLSFFPTIAVITNIELDHTDYFSSVSDIINSFKKAIAPADLVVYNKDNANACTAVSGFDGWAVGVSISDPDADFYAANLSYKDGCGSYDLVQKGNVLCRIDLPVIGAFNVANSLCAAAVCILCGMNPATVSAAMSAFKGAKRRFERRAIVKGVAIYDDYAHHPDEIEATLKATKRLGYNRVFCVFQPHTYSRTHDLLARFEKAFANADEVIFADIYAARETDTMGVSSSSLAEAAGGKYFDSFVKIADYVAKTAKSGDLVITMGAGDVYKVGDLLIDDLS